MMSVSDTLASLKEASFHTSLCRIEVGSEELPKNEVHRNRRSRTEWAFRSAKNAVPEVSGLSSVG